MIEGIDYIAIGEGIGDFIIGGSMIYLGIEGINTLRVIGRSIRRENPRKKVEKLRNMRYLTFFSGYLIRDSIADNFESLYKDEK